MVSKKKYEEIESRLMLLESENRGLKFALQDTRNKLKEIEKELEIDAL